MEQVKINLAKRLGFYLRDAKEEAGKVSWPSKKTTLHYSALVIALTVLVGIFFMGLDYGLSYLLKLVIK